ncbi:hypothetical protein BJ508DRAFT_416440 [Ascobolus immersus RN42]|uniref:Uncharacterized protein n=1 Tax=Ascobolus immersus RN42 TaxID=1160509 RepID=A0A3N4HYF6_ASCIM|nr:hypothetical protein BJ508DRAFT_416440 [Ascobolus immersus RN42]
MATQHCELPPSFLSDEAHRAVLEYIDSLPSGNPSLIGTRESDAIYNLYHRIHYGDKAAPRYFFAPPFQPFVEQYILLSIRKISPYITRLRPQYQPVHLTDPRTYLSLLLFDELGSNGRKYEDPHKREEDLAIDYDVAQRWQAGLMSEGQVQLICLCLRNLLLELSTVLDIETENEKLRYTELLRVADRRGMVKWFTSPRFRSKRLENLLRKYLAEDGVNWELVRGIEEATRLHEGASMTYLVTVLPIFWQ